MFVLLNYSYYAPLGKYLYTVIVPLAVLLGAGYLALFPARLKAVAALLLIFLMIISAVLALQNVLMPAIRTPRLHCIVSQPDFDCITENITGTQPLSFLFKPRITACAEFAFFFQKPVRVLPVF